MVGRTQINLDGYMIGDSGTGGGAFINMFKAYRISSTPEPGKLDDQGYPKESLSSDVAGQMTIPQSIQGPTVEWVIKVTGTRQMRILLDQPMTKVSQSGLVTVTGGTNSAMTCSFAGEGRVVFTVTSLFSTLSTYFKSGGTFATGTGEVVLVRATDEAAYDAGDLYTPEFISFLSGLNLKTIRTMPWMKAGGNYSNEVQWRYRVTPDHISWLTGRFPTGTWGGTAGGTDTYTAPAATDYPSGAYVGGEVFQCQFTNANTVTAPTLNVGGRGAKTIKLRTGGAMFAGSISAGAIATLVFDDLLDCWLYNSGRIVFSVPIEAQVSLANTLGVNLWRCYPEMADDTYVSTDAAYIKDNLSTSLKAYLEYGNEVWNGAFPHTVWATNRGLALGFPSGDGRAIYGYYALRHRQIMGSITTLWGAQGNLKRVLAFQGAGNNSANDTYRFKGTDLSTALGYTVYNSYVGVTYTAVGQRPIDFSDVLSYAVYYSGANFRNFDGNYTVASAAVLETAANQYASGDAGEIATALAWLDNDIRQGTRSAVLGSDTLKNFNDTICPGWNTLAVTHSKDVELYEGAHESNPPTEAICTSPLNIKVPPSSGTAADAATALAGLLTAYKGSTYAALLLQDQFRQFMSNSKSVAPAQFVICGPSQWATMPGDIFSTPYETHEAMILFNNSKRRLVVRSGS
jgi:hypothetical protein